jgi:hypothetical protein
MVPKGIIVVFKTLRETRSSRSRLNFHIPHQTCWNIYPWIHNASSLNGCVFYQMRWLKCREIGCCSYSLLRQSFENDDTLQLLLALDQLLLLEGKITRAKLVRSSPSPSYQCLPSGPYGQRDQEHAPVGASSMRNVIVCLSPLSRCYLDACRLMALNPYVVATCMPYC